MAQPRATVLRRVGHDGRGEAHASQPPRARPERIGTRLHAGDGRRVAQDLGLDRRRAALRRTRRKRADHLAGGRHDANGRRARRPRPLSREDRRPPRRAARRSRRRLRPRRGRDARRHALRAPARSAPRPVRTAGRARAALRALARRAAPALADGRVGLPRSLPAHLRHRHLPRPRLLRQARTRSAGARWTRSGATSTSTSCAAAAGSASWACSRARRASRS